MLRFILFKVFIGEEKKNTEQKLHMISGISLWTHLCSFMNNSSFLWVFCVRDDSSSEVTVAQREHKRHDNSHMLQRQAGVSK